MVVAVRAFAASTDGRSRASCADVTLGAGWACHAVALVQISAAHEIRSCWTSFSRRANTRRDQVAAFEVLANRTRPTRCTFSLVCFFAFYAILSSRAALACFGFAVATVRFHIAFAIVAACKHTHRAVAPLPTEVSTFAMVRAEVAIGHVVRVAGTP